MVMKRMLRYAVGGGEPKLTKLSHILKKNHLKKAAIQNKTVYSMYTYKGIKP